MSSASTDVTGTDASRSVRLSREPVTTTSSIAESAAAASTSWATAQEDELKAIATPIDKALTLAVVVFSVLIFIL
jgi:hypothetical protein